MEVSIPQNKVSMIRKPTDAELEDINKDIQER
jgi:hypothetical protein